jgi:hypothetical protein
VGFRIAATGVAGTDWARLDETWAADPLRDALD